MSKYEGMSKEQLKRKVGEMMGVESPINQYLVMEVKAVYEEQTKMRNEMEKLKKELEEQREISNQNIITANMLQAELTSAEETITRQHGIMTDRSAQVEILCDYAVFLEEESLRLKRRKPAFNRTKFEEEYGEAIFPIRSMKSSDTHEWVNRMVDLRNTRRETWLHEMEFGSDTEEEEVEVIDM